MSYKFSCGDLVGVHGVVFIREVDRKNKRKKRSLFKCSCGREFECNNESVTSKSKPTKSCGCEQKRKASECNITHGKSRRGMVTKLYEKWCAMKQRCYDENNPRYPNWGGRGISVCEEWLSNFESFEWWAINNGYDPSMQIDRINNDGNYEPLNCRFVTNKENSRNRGVRKGSKTGISGVNKDKKSGKFRAVITVVTGKKKSLGFYDSFFEACCARKSAENRFWNK